MPWEGDGGARVIGIVPDQIVTESLVDEPRVEGGRRSRIPSATCSRSRSSSGTSAPAASGSASSAGFGLRSGALASTVAHDAHNVVVVGVKDDDMLRAVRRLSETGGGVVVVDGGIVEAELKLPIAGLLSDAPLDEVIAGSRACVGRRARSAASSPSPFQTMAFLALSVIPSLKITDRGLVDVDRFELVPLEA